MKEMGLIEIITDILYYPFENKYYDLYNIIILIFNNDYKISIFNYLSID